MNMSSLSWTLEGRQMALLAQPDDSRVWRVQPPPQASPGFLRMLEDALHAEEQGRPFGGMYGLFHCCCCPCEA